MKPYNFIGRLVLVSFLVCALLAACNFQGQSEPELLSAAVPEETAENSTPVEEPLPSAEETQVEEESKPNETELEAAKLAAARELAELVDSLPYSGSKEKKTGFYPVVTDETGVALADFVSRGIWLELPEHSFSSPAEAPGAYVAAAGVALTNSPDYDAHQDAYALYAAAGIGYEWMRVYPHVEETARQIFGPDIVVEHQTIPPFYIDIPAARVYGTSGFGLMGSITPVIMEYEDVGDAFELEVVYVVYAYGGEENGKAFYAITSMDGDGQDDPLTSQYPVGPRLPPEGESPTQEVLDYLASQPTHQVTIKRAGDGSWIYWAHQLPGDGMPLAETSLQ